MRPANAKELLLLSRRVEGIARLGKGCGWCVSAVRFLVWCVACCARSLVVLPSHIAMSCCPTDVLPVNATYQPQGDKVYVAGIGNKKGIVFIPDIFGPHPNAFRVCDILAMRGFLVVMPDFFRGGEWPLSDFPPKDGFGGEPFQTFIKALTYDLMKPRIEQAIKMLTSLGAESLGAIGMCWGGKLAVRANCDGLVKSSASCHPSFFTVDDGKELKGPFCMLPSKDDGPMDEIRDAMNAHPFAAQNVYKYFDDMHHGWAAARGDFNDELQRTRALEAIDIMVDFFNNTL